MQHISQQRRQIREYIRKTRRNLTALQQTKAERRITGQALDLVEQRQAQNIALYLSFDGEISTRLLIECLWGQGKNVYLPVLHPFCAGYLLFLRYRPDTVLISNRFGIPEPPLDVQQILPSGELDIIFIPLVAFDKRGNRLGMGGGFYDRTLQHRARNAFLTVGLAHSCQEVDELPIASWDIPPDRILVG